MTFRGMTILVAAARAKRALRMAQMCAAMAEHWRAQAEHHRDEADRWADIAVAGSKVLSQVRDVR